MFTFQRALVMAVIIGLPLYDRFSARKQSHGRLLGLAVRLSKTLRSLINEDVSMQYVPVDVIEIVLRLTVEDLELRPRRDALLLLRYVSRAFCAAADRIDSSELLISRQRELGGLWSTRRLDESFCHRVQTVHLGFAASSTEHDVPIRGARSELIWYRHCDEKIGTFLADLMARFDRLRTLRVEVDLNDSPLDDPYLLPFKQLERLQSLRHVVSVVFSPTRNAAAGGPFPASHILSLVPIAPKLESITCEGLDGLTLSSPVKPRSWKGLRRLVLRVYDSSMPGWSSPLSEYLSSQNLEHVCLGGDFSGYFLAKCLTDSLHSLRTLRLRLAKCNGSAHSYQTTLAWLLNNVTRLQLLELDMMPWAGRVLAVKSVRDEVANDEFDRLVEQCPRADVRITVLHDPQRWQPMYIPDKRASRPWKSVASTLATSVTRSTASLQI